MELEQEHEHAILAVQISFQAIPRTQKPAMTRSVRIASRYDMLVTVAMICFSYEMIKDSDKDFELIIINQNLLQHFFREIRLDQMRNGMHMRHVTTSTKF